MNNEIKEILDKLPEEIDLKPLWYSERIKLLDYITNLQQENDDLKNRLENAVAECNLRLQENERLNKQLEYLRGEEYLNQVKWERDFNEKLVEDYESRVEKAIELLKRYGNGTFDEDLLDILKGGD